MKIINIIGKPKKLALMVAMCVAMPLTFTSPTYAESMKSSQAAGYLGKLSKQAISSGMLDRLTSGSKNKNLDRDTGHASTDLLTRIQFWHNIALDIVAIDHTPEADDTPPEQGGPTRTSRSLAMVQIAVFEAINSIEMEFEEFTGRVGIGGTSASPDAAVAQAAYDSLVRLYPAQEDRLTDYLNDDLAIIRASEPVWFFENGVRLGSRAASKIFVHRNGDRSDVIEPSFGEGGAVADGSTTFFNTPVNGGTNGIGEWEPDPNTPLNSGDADLSLGAYWGNVRPFFLNAGNQFRVEEPPLPGSSQYATSYAEASALGGDRDNTGILSTATDATRFIGNFWGYDGVPLIGVPPRIYNQIAAQIGDNKISDPVKYARYLALINITMADVAIAAWDSKYFYNFWRPVTGIRRDDGAANTQQDTSWNPIGVSVVNTDEAIRPTPPFPAYPSGHAAFGAGVFEVMRSMFGDRTAFTFVSDEFNGEGVDPFFPDRPRPLVPVRYKSFTQAQIENGRSRVFNGVHWDFDDSAGQDLGIKVASFLLNKTDAFQPRNNSSKKYKNKNSKRIKRSKRSKKW